METPAWRARARRVADLEPAAFLARWRSLPRTADQDAAMRLRCRYDLETFCRYCWPDRFDLPFNEFHLGLFTQAAETIPWSEGRPKRRDAVAAPRGYAKSTISTFAVLAHAIVYGLDEYLVIISSGQRLARALSKDLRAAFSDPAAPLARLFGPFEVTGGVDEWEVSVRGAPSVGVLAASFNTDVRGSKHPTRGIRPTRVVIDDGEKKDRVRNPEQRGIWWSTLTKDILKLGPRNGGDIVEVRGTILHPDSMLANLMDRAGWSSQLWKAIISWPERTDLWERCGRVWMNLRLGDRREEAARAFYEANRAEMDKGVEVLDPDVDDIYTLYTQIWTEGLASFLQEKQNDPIDPQAQIFISGRFARCRVERLPDGSHVIVAADGTRIKASDCRARAYWDPATGTPGGDYAVIVVVLRDQYGYGYVVDAWMRKAKASEQCEAAWVLAEKWRLSTIILESNGFQDLVAEPWPRARKARREAEQWWQTTITEQATTSDKEARIASLEPVTSAHWIQFAEHLPQVLFQQFDQFPTADHDDGPDGVQAAWAASGGSPISMGEERIR